MPSLSQVLLEASEQVSQTSTSARLDCEVLLCHVLRCNSAHLRAWPEKQLDEDQLSLFESLIQQRLEGTPVAYITGEREFWSLTLKVSPATLIPRPETELLVETILSDFQDKPALKLLDMGTGSGAIALAVATERPDWEITAIDYSAEVIEIAKTNAATHQLNNVCFIESNWFDAVAAEHFDIIVSNPPYIAKDDHHLSTGDVRFEPQTALVSGTEGMDAIEHIATHCKDHLNEGGWLMVEHGYNQKAAVYECLTNSGLNNIIQKDDLSANPRMSMAQYCSF